MTTASTVLCVKTRLALSTCTALRYVHTLSNSISAVNDPDHDPRKGDKERRVQGVCSGPWDPASGVAPTSEAEGTVAFRKEWRSGVKRPPQRLLDNTVEGRHQRSNQTTLLENRQQYCTVTYLKHFSSVCGDVPSWNHKFRHRLGTLLGVVRVCKRCAFPRGNGQDDRVLSSGALLMVQASVTHIVRGTTSANLHRTSTHINILVNRQDKPANRLLDTGRTKSQTRNWSTVKQRRI